MRSIKPRKITVDGTPYLWKVYFNSDGDGGIFIRVWRGKKVFLEQWFRRVNDSSSVTPKVVAALIAMENVP